MRTFQIPPNREQLNFVLQRLQENQEISPTGAQRLLELHKSDPVMAWVRTVTKPGEFRQSVAYYMDEYKRGQD